MIPYCSILYCVSALLSAFCTFKIYYSFKKTKDRYTEYFFKGFAFLTIFLILSSVPGGLVFNLIWAEVIYLIVWIPMYLAIFYITKIAVDIWELQKIDRILPFIISFLIILTFVLSILFFSPAEIHIYKTFSFCFEKSPSWLLGLNGAIVAVILAINAYLFLDKGLKSDKSFIKTRSTLIASGLLFFTIGAFLNYVLVPNLPKIRFLIFFAGASAIIGIALLYSGIQYKKGKEDEEF